MSYAVAWPRFQIWIQSEFSRISSRAEVVSFSSRAERRCSTSAIDAVAIDELLAYQAAASQTSKESAARTIASSAILQGSVK